jgi:hypothetical protein
MLVFCAAWICQRPPCLVTDPRENTFATFAHTAIGILVTHTTLTPPLAQTANRLYVTR